MYTMWNLEIFWQRLKVTWNAYVWTKWVIQVHSNVKMLKIIVICNYYLSNLYILINCVQTQWLTSSSKFPQYCGFFSQLYCCVLYVTFYWFLINSFIATSSFVFAQWFACYHTIHAWFQITQNYGIILKTIFKYINEQKLLKCNPNISSPKIYIAHNCNIYLIYLYIDQPSLKAWRK